MQASRIMARRALASPKIEVVWGHECVEAYGREDGTLGERGAGGVLPACSCLFLPACLPAWGPPAHPGG